MAPSTVDDPASSHSPRMNDENYLQPFFVLHKASSQHSEAKPGQRRREDSSPASPKSSGKALAGVCGDGESNCEEMHMEAFKLVWSKIETTIKGVLRDFHQDTFKAISSWVDESFNSMWSFDTSGSAETICPFPAAVDPISKQLFTALVFTRNLEMFDDHETFKDLAIHLKSSGCCVANLSSTDFTAYGGIGNVLKNLLRQFLTGNLEVADLSVLASWYKDHGNSGSPVILVINDLEHCHGPVLSEFILMLSEWVMKIPVILILGVATTLDLPRSILHSEALQCLRPFKFTLGNIGARMDAVADAVLLKQSYGFFIGHKVASFMRNYFSNHGGTLSCFIRALKIACVQHFSAKSTSFMLGNIADEDKQEKNHDLLPAVISTFSPNNVSGGGNEMTKEATQKVVSGLSELKRLHRQWSIVVSCLYDAGKYSKVHLLDLLCEALDPEFCLSNGPNPSKQSHLDSSTYKQQFPTKANGFVSQVIDKTRDLPGSLLHRLFKTWQTHCRDIPQIHEKLRELQYMLKFDNLSSTKERSMDIPITRASRRFSSSETVSGRVNEKVASFLQYLIQNHMQPIECAPFHEVVCFRDVQKLQAALMGDSRRRIQVDLVDSQRILGCTCCSRSSHAPSASMHNTAIMYNLCNEHGDLINVHDWYHCFQSILLQQENKSSTKRKRSSRSKKGETVGKAEKLQEVAIQARFCRAVTELQITGLLRMQSKRRPDVIQRVAFGL